MSSHAHSREKSTICVWWRMIIYWTVMSAVSIRLSRWCCACVKTRPMRSRTRLMLGALLQAGHHRVLREKSGVECRGAKSSIRCVFLHFLHPPCSRRRRRVWDCYAPSSSTVGSVCGKRGKVYQTIIWRALCGYMCMAVWNVAAIRCWRRYCNDSD